METKESRRDCRHMQVDGLKYYHEAGVADSAKFALAVDKL